MRGFDVAVGWGNIMSIAVKRKNKGNSEPENFGYKNNNSNNKKALQCTWFFSNVENYTYLPTPQSYDKKLKET